MSPSTARRGFVVFIIFALQSFFPSTQVKAGSFFNRESVAKYANHPAFAWQRVTTEHCTIYYESNSATVPRLEEIKTSIEASRASVLNLVRVKESPHRIHVFLVDSRSRMRDLMGSEQFGGAIARIRIVFAVVNSTNNGCSTHEFCHVIASELWGKPERWIDEGFASYSDERWNNRDTIAATLASQHRLLPLRRLAEEFLQHPEGLTYVQSSSFLGFVIDRYGIQKFKAVWKAGFNGIPKVLGRSVEELEVEWRASLPLVTNTHQP